jgi:hypothetical protein
MGPASREHEGETGRRSSATVAPASATTTAGETTRTRRTKWGRGPKLSYSARLGSDEQRLPSGLLLVRITNREGTQRAVLERYTHADAGRWRRET